MQRNKIVALIDLNDFNNHYVETFLLANILEKQYEQLSVLDLNKLSDNKYIDKSIKLKNSADLSSFKLFDESLYQNVADSPKKQNKVLNLIDVAIEQNQNLLVSLSQSENNLNTAVVEKIKELIIFVDANNISNKLLNFVINNKIKDKKVSLVIYNYQLNNINIEKELLNIRKMTKGFNVSIVTIDKINQFNSLNEIANVDPWDETYKALKKII